MDLSFKTFCSANGGWLAASPPLVSAVLGLTSWCPEMSDGLLDPTTLVSGGSDSDGGAGLVAGGSWACSLGLGRSDHSPGPLVPSTPTTPPRSVLQGARRQRTRNGTALHFLVGAAHI